MSPHLASALVDIALWLGILWLVLLAFGSRLAAVKRRRGPVKVVTRPQSPAVSSATVKVLPKQRQAS